MNCNDIEQMISLHIDNKLSLEEVSELMRHLDNCSKCRQIYKDLKNLKVILSDMQKNTTTASFCDNVMKQIKNKNVHTKQNIVFVDFIKRHFMLAAGFVFIIMASAIFFTVEDSSKQKLSPLSADNSAVEYCLNYDNYSSMDDLYEDDISSFLML